jgi:DNA-binding NtrC family response regulator
MAGEFAVRLWKAGAVAPAAGPLLQTEELALDRELLGVDDGSVSRGPNAPKLRATGPTTVRLDVPAGSARSVIVIEGVRFEALQHDVPPSDQPWKIAPGQLSRPARLACGSASSVALVRRIDWERAGPTHHLLLLPPAIRIAPGEGADLIAPALIVIGEGAVDITPADTLVPSVIPTDAAPPASFRLVELDEALENLAVIDGYVNARGTGPFRLPDADGDVYSEQLDATAGPLLDKAFRSHCFFPLLEGERRARLGLAYWRADGTSRVLVSATRPDAFVRELVDWITENARRAEATATPRARPSAQPAASPIAMRFGNIETRSPRFARVLEQVAGVAGSDLGILLLGESGTGKEHLARATHEASPRAQAPFVAVNCSAIAENLIESELFGHKKGAFTGAQTDRQGAFVAAHGGTLLLDEIGDAPLRVQLALLRALEEKTIRAVGSDLERPVDVRVLAATSRDLDELIARGLFRKDLYYRLAELSVQLPPLRERREDIPALVATILHSLGEPCTVSQQAEDVLIHHDWPGNIRELRNALRRAVASRRGADVLQAVHFSQLGHIDGTGVDGTSADGLDVGATPIRFPVHVVRRADEIWRDGQLPSEDAANRYEQRAVNRAALLCLSARTPMTAWPKALTREWHRLFGERWATSEEGRGLRGVMRELGLDARNEGARERVFGAVARGSRR